MMTAFNQTKLPGIYTKVDIVKPDLPWYLDSKLVDRLRKRKDIGKTVPEFMVRDIFKSYYNKEMHYALSPAMLWWHKILQRVSNYMLKMITQDRISYSYLVTLHILKNISQTLKEHKGWKTMNNKRNNEMKKMLKHLKKQQTAREKDEKRQKKGQQPIHEQKLGAKPNQPIEESKPYKDFMKAISTGITTALGEAGKAISQLQQLEGGDQAGSTTVDMVEEFHKTGKLDDGFPAQALQSFIRQTLKRFKDSGVGQPFYVEESLFEAEEIEDICNYEGFAHIALLLDLTVKSEMRHLLFDVYVDVSSSMGSSRYLTKDENVSMRKIDMAINLLTRLKQHGFVKNLYCFDTRVWEHDLNKINEITCCGGTNIDTVLRHAKELGRPSMIITDCEDQLLEYYNNAFIMSVEPRINGSDGMRDLIKSKNVIVYYKGQLRPPVKASKRDTDIYVHPLYLKENQECYAE